MTDSFELTREIEIQATPQTVFSYLTEASKMKEWFAEIVESDPHPGGVFHIGTHDGVHCRGEFVEVIPCEKVVFTWGGIEEIPPGESTVEITLRAEGEGTHLTLRHYNVTQKPAADSFGQGWKEHALPLLQSACEGRTVDGVCFESGNECSKH